MKKFIAAVSAVFIAVTLSVVAVAAPASAHTATLSAAVSCNAADGSATVTWTVDNDYPEALTITASNNAAIPTGPAVAATSGHGDTTKTYTQTIPAPAAGKTASATLSFLWVGDNFTQKNTTFTTNKVSSDCVVPTPKDATAVLVFTAPTCTTAQTVAQGATNNASWNGSINLSGNGNSHYSTSATAASHHQFSNGSSTLSFSGNLSGPLSGPNCDNTSTKQPLCQSTGNNSYKSRSLTEADIIAGKGINAGDIIPPFSYIVGGVSHSYPGQNWDTAHQAIYNNGCVPPPVPQCIPNSAISFTYSQNDANEGDVIVANVPGSTGVLCNPIYVTATSWKYTNNASIWPQTRDIVDQLGEISTPGTYHYAAQVTCGQGDIYASFSSTAPSLNPGPVLNSPSHPFTESFLSDLGLAGGLTPTYTNDNNNCFIPTPETGNPTTTVASCKADSANSITLPAVPGGVWSISDAGGDNHTYAIGTGVAGFTPANFDQYTVTLVDGSNSDGYLVTGTSTQFTPIDASTLDCNTQIPPVQPQFTPIITCDASGSVDIVPATGIDYYVGDTQVTQGTTVLDAAAESGLQGDITVTAKAETGFEFGPGETSVSWAYKLGTETSCTFTTQFGTCVANDSNTSSSESISMTFTNPGDTSATFTVTGGSNNVNESFIVAGNTTSSVTLVDANAASGDVFHVSVNGGTAQDVSVPAFAGCLNALGGDPSANQATCNEDRHVAENNASITIDLEPGLIYSISGPAGFTELDNLTTASNGGASGDWVAASGLAPGIYTVSVTADTADGYVLDGKYATADWPFKITLQTPVCDIAVSVTPADCASNIESATLHTDTVGVPSITVTNDPDVVYTAVQTDVTPNVFTVLTQNGSTGTTTTDVTAGEYTVTVALSAQGVTDGFVIPVGDTSFGPFDLTAFCPPTEASWNAGASGTDAVCTAGNTTDGVITLVHTVGQTGKVTYTITNAANHVVYTGNTDTTVNVPAGTYTVKATPPAGDGISGNTQTNPDGSEIFAPIVIGTSSTDCDGNLAFTGGTIAWLGFVLAGGMLFLGIALLYMRRRGNRTAE